MIANKKEFSFGLILMVAFVAVLIAMFSPIFKGQNGLEYLDALYNSISKGSAYYIPKLKEEAAAFNGKAVSLGFNASGDAQAARTALLFTTAGLSASASGAELKLDGDLGRILAACLEDADHMYHNRGDQVAAKYGNDERQALYDWWSALKGMEKSRNDQKQFKEAKTVANIQKKAVETAYNYYRIEPQKITDRMGIVVFSLVFYVAYTLWYGFSILMMFEGWGLKLEH